MSSITLPTICCWETDRWQRNSFVKLAGPDDKNTIKFDEDTLVKAGQWGDLRASNPAGEPWMPATMGDLVVPKGIYVADKNDEKKLLVVSEITGTDDTRNAGFWGEERGVIAFKAGGATLIALVPIYAIGNMFLNLIRIPLNLIDCCRKAFADIKEAWNRGGLCEAAFALARRVIVDMTTIVVEGIWSIVRVPFYAAALQVALIYAVFSPYNGRQVVADIERAWHYPCTVEDDIAFKENAKTGSFDELVDTLNNKVHFLFFCFQPRNTCENDDRYVKLAPSTVPAESNDDDKIKAERKMQQAEVVTSM